jgi:prepilin peptidase CpaA
MIAEILVIVALPLLLALAAGYDLASFTIPNFLNLAVIAVFPLFALAAGLSLPAVGLHLMAGFAGLALGFALFAFGWIGAGEQLGVALWLGFKDLMPYALLASVFGGFLTLALLMLRRWPLPESLARHAWIIRLHDAKSGVPYGVALAAGAFILLPDTEIFRLAAGV